MNVAPMCCKWMDGIRQAGSLGGVRYIIEHLTVQETVLIQGNVFNFVNHKKEEEVLK